MTVDNGLIGGGDVGDLSMSINTSYNGEYNKGVILENIFVVSIKMVLSFVEDTNSG